MLCHARELAIQITSEFKRLGKYTNFKVKAVYGGIEESVDIHTLKTKKPHILVATPGRLMSLLKARPKVIEAQNVEYFIVDECDRMLDSVKMRYLFTYIITYFLCNHKNNNNNNNNNKPLNEISHSFLRIKTEVTSNRSSTSCPARSKS